ncbi:hypothetical protein L873DRAFT_1807181 [Choiromyces venosus 120613-1]|uniref:Uncharacterized protein n=1 Tax=Choiromyces venosus 120613-1 TaxID=1336337 RepID=A0A3N4K016_9PEZI|nr:hypothetical protein L873DRAFT_1807181 [Choiromyces venosus 120613-1]
MRLPLGPGGAYMGLCLLWSGCPEGAVAKAPMRPTVDYRGETWNMVSQVGLFWFMIYHSS